jgi:hypothetical protein
MSDSHEWIVISGFGGKKNRKKDSAPQANRYYPTAVLLGNNLNPVTSTKLEVETDPNWLVLHDEPPF